MNTPESQQTISNKDLIKFLDTCDVVVEDGEAYINYYELDHSLYTVFKIDSCELECEFYGEEEEIILNDDQLDIIESYLHKEYLNETESYISTEYQKLDEFLKSITNQTKEEMTINANNFTGVLENGNRYKITTNTKHNKAIEESCLTIKVEEYVYDGWFSNADYTVTKWYQLDEYKTALHHGLSELGYKLGVELVKSNCLTA